MLINESFRGKNTLTIALFAAADATDVQTSTGAMRVFLFEPQLESIPTARFPGIVVFSEIYQVTGPVARFCRQICGNGYVVAACSSFHEFSGPEPFAYDVAGTDLGNRCKVEKKVSAYDEDATLTIDLLQSLPSCNGRIGATGRCEPAGLGLTAKACVWVGIWLSAPPLISGNAFPAQLCLTIYRVRAACCFFATDIHSSTLGLGKQDDSLARIKDITGELVMIFGKLDNHVPREGRDLIRKSLDDAGVVFSFYEPAWAQYVCVVKHGLTPLDMHLSGMS